MNKLNLLAQKTGQSGFGPNTNSGGDGWGTTPGRDSIGNPILPKQLQGGEQAWIKLFPSIIGFLFLVGSVGFFFMILIGGLQWIFSGGDKGSVENAKGRISSALIGLVILFSVYGIITLVEAFFNVNILTIDIGPLKIQ